MATNSVRDIANGLARTLRLEEAVTRMRNLGEANIGQMREAAAELVGSESTFADWYMATGFVTGPKQPGWWLGRNRVTLMGKNLVKALATHDHGDSEMVRQQLAFSQRSNPNLFKSKEIVAGFIALRHLCWTHSVVAASVDDWHAVATEMPTPLNALARDAELGALVRFVAKRVSAEAAQNMVRETDFEI